MVHFFHSCLCFLVWLCMVTQILGDNSTKNKQVASCQNDPPVNQHRRGKSTILRRSMACPFHSVCLPQGISEYMEVSLNRGTPKSSILVGFSTINHPFGVPLISETSISEYIPVFLQNIPIKYVVSTIFVCLRHRLLPTRGEEMMPALRNRNWNGSEILWRK